MVLVSRSSEEVWSRLQNKSPAAAAGIAGVRSVATSTPSTHGWQRQLGVPERCSMDGRSELFDAVHVMRVCLVGSIRTSSGWTAAFAGSQLSRYEN
jgi:hypothetical protein